MAYKGRYKVKNLSKYRGDPEKAIYRSGWELRFCRYLDSSPSIIEWALEPFSIPYYSNVDKKMHKYYPDFWVKQINVDGTESTVVYEIKPLCQTAAPKKPETWPSKRNRRFIKESITYEINKAKWLAAQEFCLDRGWKFQILTEKNLGVT